MFYVAPKARYNSLLLDGEFLSEEAKLSSQVTLEVESTSRSDVSSRMLVS